MTVRLLLHWLTSNTTTLHLRQTSTNATQHLGHSTLQCEKLSNSDYFIPGHVLSQYLALPGGPTAPDTSGDQRPVTPPPPGRRHPGRPGPGPALRHQLYGRPENFPKSQEPLQKQMECTATIRQLPALHPPLAVPGHHPWASRPAWPATAPTLRPAGKFSQEPRATPKADGMHSHNQTAACPPPTTGRPRTSSLGILACLAPPPWCKLTLRLLRHLRQTCTLHFWPPRGSQPTLADVLRWGQTGPRSTPYGALLALLVPPPPSLLHRRRT